MTAAVLATLRTLASQETLPLRVAGGCMAPSLVEGSVVAVSPAAFYVPGDLVCFRGPTGGLVVHRVIGYHPGRGGIFLWTQADSAWEPDAPIALERVLGKVRRPVGLPARLAAAGRFLRVLARRLGP